jgi:putative copper resistance protein D
MPFHAFFAVTILMMPTVLGAAWYDSLGLDWSLNRLADQGLGGGVAWVFAELPSLAVLGALFIQWSRSDARAAKAQDRRIDAGTDHSLEEYNAYLARLAEHEKRGS